MYSLMVSTQKQQYPVHIGFNLFNKQESFNFLTKNCQIVIITNDTIFNLYFIKFTKQLNLMNIKTNYVLIPEGEQYKTLQTLNIIFTYLLKNHYNRDVILIGLGGGVIGDITGLAAALYQRGIKFIQVPTTLLAQVDAAIGGKTAVNHILGKNMIGSFYSPIAVISNLDCLYSLSKREFISGMSEVIKYGIILDKFFFNWLEKNVNKILNLCPKEINYCIKKCCSLKTKVVIKDEYEHNHRSLLNLGHTFGHAIEAKMNYTWLHGEAVSVGIIIATLIAEELKILQHQDTIRIINIFQKYSLPIHSPSNMNAEQYLEYIYRDKKILKNNIRIIIPVEIGKAIIYNITENMILNAIQKIQNINL
ncbi:3-dehydroquinate synthase [Enterobacteriaceae endosymbiont of Macroplea appendiculata]|uniref:3-dehydroquinate synthase n=1 Tax=Enterobacteriaceae endosymbiont of Macroplea appendiculata TaxID=2675790 RepID=UPI001449AFC2|nr:3-dehydroquinate synthase [Enterobacteriaceae endosymbiont of Macroplea appendiculata]QJC30944.1 3-dehydroquinate synthase [Enterobacteriaceae endosymbiont of Macroplea appendiculata]